MSIPATSGETVTLALVPEDGNTTLYPQAKIYTPGNATPSATIDLSHIGDGRYEGSWVPTSVGTYTTVFIIYLDSGHTVEAIHYTREAEQVFVTESGMDSLASSISRILGLVHENAFIDNTTYDSSSQMLSARIRIFDSKTNAQNATDGGSETTGLIATYSIQAEYEAPGRMKQYRMVKD